MLAVHTELRAVLQGRSSTLARSLLPRVVPYDLLKFLALWDYERCLAPEARALSTAACRARCSALSAARHHHHASPEPPASYQTLQTRARALPSPSISPSAPGCR